MTETFTDFATDEDGDIAAMPAREALGDVVRMVEAIIFASSEPVSEKMLLERLPVEVDLLPVLKLLQSEYRLRGVNLVKSGDGWAFRTASDLSFLMSRDQVKQKKLSRAALEVLAIIAYHQPVTRAEMEDIRGVETSKGTLDVLMETGWVKLRGRRRTPGRPVTYGTTDSFLDHFGLAEIRDLPGMDELRGAGLLSARLPSNFSVPMPTVRPDELLADEDPLTAGDIEELGLFMPKVEDDESN
ncbi:SMC-Scp complex subunit ScpB [Bacillus subtilis]|nr:SMC-Scp complex subunit ScpB [Bacillus subtilis]